MRHRPQGIHPCFCFGQNWFYKGSFGFSLFILGMDVTNSDSSPPKMAAIAEIIRPISLYVGLAVYVVGKIENTIDSLIPLEEDSLCAPVGCCKSAHLTCIIVNKCQLANEEYIALIDILLENRQFYLR